MKKTVFDNKLYKIVHYFFNLLEIKVPDSELRGLLFSNPYYPSLAALSDVCKMLDVEHYPVKISFEELKKHGTPVLVHLPKNGGDFVVIKEFVDKNIIYCNSSGETIILPESSFINDWEGIAFYAFQSVEKKRRVFSDIVSQLFFKIRPFSLLFLSVILLIYLIVQNPDWSFITIVCIKLLGIVGCICLIRKSLDTQGANWMNKICVVGQYINCDAVMNSSASMLFGFLHLTDIGFVYFTGGFISLLISIVQGETYSTMIILFSFSVLSIPMIVYSIYHQVFLIRKFCLFCLFVQTLLLLENILFMICFKSLILNDFHINAFMGILLSFTMVAILWSYLKPLINQVNEAYTYKSRYLNLRNIPEVFNIYLNKSEERNMEISGAEIIMGNHHAELSIVVIINLYCGPCAQVHGYLKKVMNEYRDDVKMVIRFLSPDKDRQETLYLLGVYYAMGEELFEKALDDWFLLRDYEKFKEKYPMPTAGIEVKMILERQDIWIERANIKSTPSVFLNGRLVGQEYSMEDIPLLVRNSLINK